MKHTIINISGFTYLAVATNNFSSGAKQAKIIAASQGYDPRTIQIYMTKEYPHLGTNFYTFEKNIFKNLAITA